MSADKLPNKQSHVNRESNANIGISEAEDQERDNNTIMIHDQIIYYSPEKEQVCICMLAVTHSFSVLGLFSKQYSLHSLYHYPKALVP